MASSDAPMPALFPDERVEALSIGALLAQVQVALSGAFPNRRGVWVRGEIQTIADHRSGHCYMDLVDPDTARGRERPVLKVNCWRTTWGPIRRLLAAQGITLQPGMVVTLRGRVELYAPRAQVNFIASEVDVSALLGRMAAQRAALLAALETEGLLRCNAGLAVPAVPLVVGLVASPGTEGFDDFVGQLRGSGLGFSVRLAAVQVQGLRAPASIANGLATVSRAGCDVTVLVRGGGAKADLAAFDTEVVARAVASHPLPVWTGIGHTGDQSVADVVANRAFITPTECGQELVRRVTTWSEAALGRARYVANRVVEVVGDADADHVRSRHRLAGAARAQLRHHRQGVEGRAARLSAQARRQLEAAGLDLERRTVRLAPLTLAAVAHHEDRLASLRRLLGAYDVDRQLERGYTLTLDEQGTIVRSVRALEDGVALVTRFADGSARSVVDSVTMSSSDERAAHDRR
ncbi:MAG TPA: exodeoxyribonuclease VII large subunit [Acidimicrobiaceae bacterium]|nr:exodeoxyribonuclease VII large subunit [Acidimicrobiaceae bacterium]